jgi:hypothetical protein
LDRWDALTLTFFRRFGFQSDSCRSFPSSPRFRTRAPHPGRASPEELEDELGDILFVLVNLARFVKVDPEQALRRANTKFRRRFAYIERKLAERGKRLKEAGGWMYTEKDLGVQNGNPRSYAQPPNGVRSKER